MGGFHFLTTFLISAILIYIIFHVVLCCLPYCCKPATKTFQLKKEAWDQQAQTFHFRNREISKNFKPEINKKYADLSNQIPTRV